MTPDTVIVGGGHNALVAAFYLAKAGRRPLVLERQPCVGGGAITTEIHPGFRCPGLTHELLLEDQVARDMGLARAGLQFIALPARACAPSPDAAPIVLHDDLDASVQALTSACPGDGERYRAFQVAVQRIASVIGTLFDSPPPNLDVPSASDVLTLLQTGRRFRSLGKRDEYRLLRWLPMPIGDLMLEWFESDRLRALLAGPGVSGTMLGPRSAGSSLVLLWREAGRLRAGGHSLRARGGPGAMTSAMAEAARAAGAEIRTSVAVDRIVIERDGVTGVIAGGHEIPCGMVLSGLDPKTTFLSLVDATALAPEFATMVRNYRASGTVAKVNLALSSLPAFAGVRDPMSVAGRIHIGPDLDYLERAFDHVKYGEASTAPWLDITIPSILDTDLAPPGAHVASIYVHYAPYALRGSDWNAEKPALLANTLTTLETYAPGIRSLVVEAEVITPLELQTRVGLSGGHIFHGEVALDQLFTMRPALGHADYGSPIRGLHLCGAGTHPGAFMTGASGRLAARAVLKAVGR